MRRRTFSTILALAVIGAVISLSAATRADEARRGGLIGIQYGSEDFEDAEGLVNLSSLDQTWGRDDGFGKQWVAKWQGLIVGPTDGDVKFTIETDQTAKIEIAGKVVVNSKGAKSGSMNMVKDRNYPIVLTYIKEGSGYDCALSVRWSWAGQAGSVIGGHSLIHSPQKAAELKTIVDAAEADEDEDDDSDDNDKELSFSDLPAAVQATVKANLNGAVLDDIDTGTEDGKRVYEIDAKLADNRELKLTILTDGTLYSRRLDEPPNPKEKMPVEGIIPPGGDTVALWLFDESDYPHTTITDAGEYAKADLCLMDGGKMVPGKFGNALQVTGSDYALCYAGFAGKVSEEELRERDGKPSALWGPTEGQSRFGSTLLRRRMVSQSLIWAALTTRAPQSG